MSDNSPILESFLEDVKPTQTLWALQEKDNEGWVVLDSAQFEETDVMPLWSSKELAQKHCCEEWSNYVPTEISVADWMEFWIEDLSEDGVMIGVNWQGEDDDIEIELVDFSQALVGVEHLS